jgi:protein transport protein SEC20
MQTELTRSQFAQETLDRSTAELKDLGEQYADLDSVLGASKKLAGTLLRSNKSDTWYLQTAFYILVVTISWLVFRRLFYGPLWWLLWLPLKLTYKFFIGVFGAVGLAGSARSETGIVASSGVASSFPTASISGMADQTVKMRDKEPVRRGDGTVLVDSDQPRNPKKRAFDTDVENEKLAQAGKEPVKRGDGTVLEESDEPRNPHKRALDTEVEKDKAAAEARGKDKDEL